MNYALVNSLIDQSTEYMSDSEAGRYNIPTFHRHDFARLLILEACKFIEDTLDDHFASEQLKEHFGLC